MVYICMLVWNWRIKNFWSLSIAISSLFFSFSSPMRSCVRRRQKKNDQISWVFVWGCVLHFPGTHCIPLLLWRANISDTFVENVMNCYSNHAQIIIIIITLFKLLDPFSYKKLVFDRYLLQCILKVAKGRFMLQRSNYGFP